MYEVGDWLEIHGGSAPYREAIEIGFMRGDHSIEAMTSDLGCRVSVVFCADDSSFVQMANCSESPRTYVVGITRDLDTGLFLRALRNGAAGVVWEDTPISHLVRVVRSALNHDFLLPAELVSLLLDGNRGGQQRASEPDRIGVELLQELAAGHTISAIARRLGFSERTIQRRVTNLCLELGASSPAQAVHLAHQAGILR